MLYVIGEKNSLMDEVRENSNDRFKMLKEGVSEYVVKGRNLYFYNFVGGKEITVSALDEQPELASVDTKDIADTKGIEELYNFNMDDLDSMCVDSESSEGDDDPHFFSKSNLFGGETL